MYRGMILAVIPAYNEAGYIGRVIREARQHVDVLVVDDSSDDATQHVASQNGAYCIPLPENRGVTNALHVGIQWGIERCYSACVLLDADGAHAPSDIPSLVDHHLRLDNAVTIGARADFRSIVPTLLPSTKYLANYCATTLVNLVLGTDFMDVASGFRVLDLRVAGDLFAVGRGFGGLYEMLRAAMLRNLRMSWSPVAVRYDAREPLLTSRRELLDFLQVMDRWVTDGALPVIGQPLKSLINCVEAETTCSIQVADNILCLVPVPGDALAVQLQDPYFASEDRDIPRFPGLQHLGQGT